VRFLLLIFDIYCLRYSKIRYLVTHQKQNKLPIKSNTKILTDFEIYLIHYWRD
jgi:hypothetical protein